jgi:Secretory lipase
MGYSTLDSIRAVWSSGNFTGIDQKPLTTLYGYSGGAVASGWVDFITYFRCIRTNLSIGNRNAAMVCTRD